MILHTGGRGYVLGGDVLHCRSQPLEHPTNEDRDGELNRLGLMETRLLLLTDLAPYVVGCRGLDRAMPAMNRTTYFFRTK